MSDVLVTSLSSYGPVLFLLCLAGVLGLAILLVTHVLGPKRVGEAKHAPYESGMKPIGDARRHFNVRFYLVAMLFLLFDVEIIFLWPWAKLYYKTATAGEDATGLTAQLIEAGFDKTYLAGAMAVFIGILLVGFLYEWRKGAFQWD